MLPQSKSDFPKCLYLDQNFWIGLAQASLGMPEGDRFKDALVTIENAISAGRLLVPLSLVHVIEASIPGDEKRRERLLGFMCGLSRGTAMRYYKEIRPQEIENALRAWYKRGGESAIRMSVVHDSVFSALGVHPDLSLVPVEQRDLFKTVIESPPVFRRMFADLSAQRDQIRQAVANEIAGVEQLQKCREQVQAKATPVQQELLYYSRMLNETDARSELEKALQVLNIGAEQYCHDILKPEKLVRFAEMIPFIHVFVTLELTHGRNTSRTFDRNDPRDLVWLATAIPYSNIVAGETYWTTLAAPLGTTYGTKLTSDPKNLPQLLADEGCC